MLESAYCIGVFPMANPLYGVVTWHRPSKRAILPLDGFHISHSLARTLRRTDIQVTIDKDFEAVMRGCAEGRPVWISEEFVRIYTRLHWEGKAHSAEVWVNGQIAGGVYGVRLGRAFFAESMFHRVRDMSKVALAHLIQHLRDTGAELLDVQYLTPHLASLGAVEVPDEAYQKLLRAALSPKQDRPSAIG